MHGACTERRHTHGACTEHGKTPGACLEHGQMHDARRMDGWTDAWRMHGAWPDAWSMHGVQTHAWSMDRCTKQMQRRMDGWTNAWSARTRGGIAVPRAPWELRRACMHSFRLLYDEWQLNGLAQRRGCLRKREGKCDACASGPYPPLARPPSRAWCVPPPRLPLAVDLLHPISRPTTCTHSLPAPRWHSEVVHCTCPLCSLQHAVNQAIRVGHAVRGLGCGRGCGCCRTACLPFRSYTSAGADAVRRVMYQIGGPLARWPPRQVRCAAVPRRPAVRMDAWRPAWRPAMRMDGFSACEATQRGTCQAQLGLCGAAAAAEPSAARLSRARARRLIRPPRE
eukprot:363596-Chlamydomonas_euryale.AAC.13